MRNAPITNYDPSVLDWIVNAFADFQSALDWISVAAIFIGIIAFAVFTAVGAVRG